MLYGRREFHSNDWCAQGIGARVVVGRGDELLSNDVQLLERVWMFRIYVAPLAVAQMACTIDGTKMCQEEGVGLMM